jgi:hypothetical protein
MQGEEFEWDDAKAALNWLNHGVSFEMAREVFRDIFAVEWTDDQRADAAGIDLLKLPFFPPQDTPDQAGLKRLLAGITEACALPEQLDAVARRHVIAVGQRVEREWLQ